MTGGSPLPMSALRSWEKSGGNGREQEHQEGHCCSHLQLTWRQGKPQECSCSTPDECCGEQLQRGLGQGQWQGKVPASTTLPFWLRAPAVGSSFMKCWARWDDGIIGWFPIFRCSCSLPAPPQVSHAIQDQALEGRITSWCCHSQPCPSLYTAAACSCSPQASSWSTKKGAGTCSLIKYEKGKWVFFLVIFCGLILGWRWQHVTNIDITFQGFNQSEIKFHICV